jgi:aminotransferase in exopolysaccharide biosynthesis
MIPLSVPELRGNEWSYVKECLDTAWVSSAGTYVERFEERFADYVGARHAVACVNGTAALQVALRLCGVERDDEVLVPTLTFAATINAVLYLGAHPVFFDADSFYNLDVDAVGRFVDEHTEMRDGVCINRSSGRRVAAVCPVHVFGNAVDLDALAPLCADRGIAVVEDAAESLGTRYTDGRHTGTIGRMAAFSFNGNKIITTGGGGMIVTDDASLADRARYLTTQAKDDPVRYVHHEMGYNFRLTNVAAAIGVAQMEVLPEYLESKRRTYEVYREAAASIEGLRIADVPDYATNNHWMIGLQIDADAYGRDRESLMTFLHGQGIQTRPVWHPNHLQRAYAGAEAHEIRRALELVDVTLNLPASAGITDDERAQVIDALRRGRATGV